MKHLLHRLRHAFGWAPCRNDCHALSDGRILHVVECVVCGEIVLAFWVSFVGPATQSDRRLLALKPDALPVSAQHGQAARREESP